MFPLARLRSAVFLLNSRMGPFTVPPRGGPLLPKLRGYLGTFPPVSVLVRPNT